MSADVDRYFANAKRWRAEAEALRALLLECGLDEALKWGKPCYLFEGKNVAIIQKMKDFVALMFFEGILLDDPKGLLEEQGENTHAARRLTFKSPEDVKKRAAVVRGFARQAIANKKAGRAAPKREQRLVLVEELRARLEADAALKAAFEGLTPGRQREYNLHIGGAKQSKTRASRVDRCVPKILEGKGFRDR